MNTVKRRSAGYEELQDWQINRQEVNGMFTATIPSRNHQKDTRLSLIDYSYLTRFGVKGSNAENWLIEQGFSIPISPNTWRLLPQDGLIARLGRSEFLIEDSETSQMAPCLATQSRNPPDQVYPVLRQDFSLLFSGVGVHDLLRQTCNINFQSLDLETHPVILTNMIGIAVIVIPGMKNNLPHYRIWCDYTYGHYLWQTLVQITEELCQF